MNDHFQELAQLLFPDVSLTPADIEERFPARALPEGAKVTRMAPSPTGFMHLGNLYSAVISERLAHQSGGVFFLRIEDTDLKRSVENGVQKIIEAFNSFNLILDEGATIDGENGSYGPYYQRQRKEIYHVFVRQLVEQGMAYPCFCSEEEMAQMRAQQEERKENFGYYGAYAKCRNLTLDEIKEKIDAGIPYVIRFRSTGSLDRKFAFTDLVKGKMELPENDQDLVLLKSDGIPTYHFAHIIDDHFMGTTHVVRGEEWLPSLPMHVQLFKAMGWKSPKYLHTAQLMKIDEETGSKRKLSKRKDPELALSYYRELGYPTNSVLEYLLTLLNSNFEEWRMANPERSLYDFPFTTAKMSASGALFDINKLNDVSKNVVSRMSAEAVLEEVLDWAREFDPEFAALLERDTRYAAAILSIGRGGKKPRKDFGLWSEVKPYLSFFYEELFDPDYSGLPQAIPAELQKKMALDYVEYYDPADDNNAWFAKLKDKCADYGLCADMKEFKKNPQNYLGSVADLSMVLRVVITGRSQSPDLGIVCSLLGKDTIRARVERFCAAR